MSSLKNRWVYRLFNAVLIMALPLIGLAILVKWRRRIFAKGLHRWGERWGHWSAQRQAVFSTPGRWWWVHAVSVGEVKAIETFLRRVPQAAGVKVLLSLVTPEALIWAENKQLADQIIAAPIDLPWVVRRTMRHVRPEAFLSVESEFWPNLLREAKRSGSCVALINGRISQRSFHSYSRIRFLLNALWETLDLWAVRQEDDAERFRNLGVSPEKIQVTGNLKYDLFVDRRTQARPAASSSPVVVMGSMREGEEREVLPAMEKVLAEYPQLRVIWAPRHIERISEVEDLLTSRGFSCVRKSTFSKNGNGHGLPAHLLWDSMGDLLEAYRQADIAVIGGSFVSKGGQNPIEPAALHLPVLFGPSMENFKGVAESMVRDGGARRVSASELAGHLAELVKDPGGRREMGEKAWRTVQSEQGATDRTIELVKRLTHA